MLAGGIYQGRWPASMALLEELVLMLVYLTIAVGNRAGCIRYAFPRPTVGDRSAARLRREIRNAGG